MKPTKKTKLRLHLDARKMSAVALSKKVKCVSKRTIQAIAQGKREPSIVAAREIAKALRVNVGVLFS